MDFKVKSQLLPLLFSGGMAAAQAQTVLQQDTHMFREGDVILKQEVQYKSPGRSGKNVVWDFSELTPLENEYRESYDRMDSLFTCSGMNATYQYRFSGDSLLCVGYFNQLLQMRHLLPELIMHYPLTYSDSICSFYYGEGKYSHTLNLAVYGETVRKADAEGILFLSDGEVLSDVLRVHESVRTGQRIASSPAILSFGETSSYSKDSLIYHLTHDSITWRVDAYRWYAPGYRYPVFETVQTFVCASGIPVRHFQRSYYYPVEEQKYLSEDRVNMAVRETLATQAERDEEELYTKKKSFGKKSGNYAYNSYFSPDGGLLKIDILLDGPSSVDLLLCSLSGICLFQKTLSECDAGMYQETFDLTSLPSADYLLSVIINGEVNSEKILKNR